MEAAVERPPHLKAIMPVAATFDLYDSASHHGLVSTSFITPFARADEVIEQRDFLPRCMNPLLAHRVG
jgi:predicted acyl esterase